MRDALLSLSTDRVGVKVVYQGTGAVTESDVSLAGAVGGVVLAFNVKHGAETEKLAAQIREATGGARLQIAPRKPGE